MQEIKFNIRLSVKELWQFSLYHSNKGFLGLFNIIFSVAAIYLLITRYQTLTAFYRIMLLVCALMFTVWQPFLLYRKARKQAQSPGVKEPMELIFDSNGLRVNQGENHLDLTWEQVGRVEKIPTMLIFYMDRIHAYLVPLACLTGREEEFYRLLKEKVPKSRRKRV